MMAKPMFLLTETVIVGLLLSGCSTGAASPPPATTAGASPSTSSPPPPTTPASPTVSVATPDPVDAAFKAKVDALCQSWVTDGNKHPQPFYMGNPAALTAAQLPQAGSWLDSLAVNHELVASMTALGVPTRGATVWSTLGSHFAAYQAERTAAIAAAKASDLTGWAEHAVAADTERDAILSGLATSGFPFADPCQIVFTKVAYHGE